MAGMASSRSWLRAAMVALALAVGAGSVGSALALTRSLREQLATASGLGLHAPGLLDELRRAESPVRVRLHLARALLGLTVEEESLAEATGDLAEHRRRLETAESLARSVLSHHPASWEAASIAGAALFMRWSHARDPRLLQEYRRWEQPLLFARAVAPDGRPAGRYLAAAYLELWPALSEEKRALAAELVASAFTDRQTFGRLLDPWLRVVPGEAGLAPIPDRPWAWGAIRERAGRDGDWEAYCEAWRRERRAWLRDLRAQLAQASLLASGGELSRSRRELLRVLAAAPPDLDFAPLVERALRLLPHGPRQSKPSAPAARWLTWAMLRELGSEPQPLSVESLVRLRGLAFPDGSGEPLTAALSAWVERVRGRAERAEELESRPGGTWQPEWAPYHLLAARSFLEQGRPDRAREALLRVHPDWQQHPVFVRIAERLGESPPTPPPAPDSIGGPLDWTYSGGLARLTFEAPVATDGLAVALAEVPARGTALSIRWDGSTLGCRPLDGGTRILQIPVAVRPGVHQLELEPLTEGRVYAGSVELRPPTPPGRPG